MEKTNMEAQGSSVGRPKSMSDASFHSPRISHSPMDTPFSTPRSSPLNSPCRAIVPVQNHLPPPPSKTLTPPSDLARKVSFQLNYSTAQPQSSVKQDGGDTRPSRGVELILRRSRRDGILRRMNLGFRVSQVIFCLVSFSVMASDNTHGWSGDSFYRYREYRYCVTVNVIGFVYSGVQAYDLGYHLITGNRAIRHHLRCHLDFVIDQVLAYILMSASSSAATRVADWESNWGSDEFTEMINASVAMSFLAFSAFALSSLLSGYHLCIRDLT